MMMNKKVIETLSPMTPGFEITLEAVAAAVVAEFVVEVAVVADAVKTV
jgi:uncharacterized membrane protein YbhN (UPF0104 family)